MKKFLKFVLILLLVVVVLALAYQFMARPWFIRWGASDAEVNMSLPGDELTSLPPDQSITRAITIRAPAEIIFPWLAQLGADRGGLYSYDKLENLIGCKVINADEILPQFQNPLPEDPIKLCGGTFGPPPFIVADIKPGEYLILGHHPLGQNGEALSSEWTDTWSFVLRPINTESTRLIIRSRSSLTDPIFKIIEPISFFMERGMMYGIQSRAEK